MSLSPVRRLYRILCALETPDIVRENLLTLDDYKGMRGDPEARFCEWAYERLDGRTLVKGLVETLVRITDARKLARDVGCPADRLAGLGHEALVREALSRIELFEAMVPLPARDGVGELQSARDELDKLVSRTILVVHDSTNSRSSAGELCRRGTERLLKMIVFFLWDLGLDDVIRDVVSGSLHGFRGGDVARTNWAVWLHGTDLGAFNFLLHSLSEEISERRRAPAFLTDGRALWPEGVFQTVRNLADHLKEWVHDTNTGKRFEEDTTRAGRLFPALGKLLKKIEDETLWIPRTIQFFRRIDDGHGLHHEGYDETGSRVRFYESDRDFELHQPYLFMSATNPSGIDVSCVRLRDEFTRPV